MARQVTIAEMRQHLAVDKNDLDTGFEQQPDLMFQVAEQCSLAIEDRDTCKLKLEQVVAKLDQQLREEAGDRKITEAGIARELETMPKVIDLKKELSGLNLQVGLWQALRTSFEQRNDALNGLSRLHAANYFTRSSAKRTDDQYKERQADLARREGGARRTTERR